MTTIELTTVNPARPGVSREQIAALSMSTLAFAVNFAVWVMFSVIGIKIKAELNLNETEFGLLVATPVLTGSLIRLPLGVLTDRYGGRIACVPGELPVVQEIVGVAHEHEGIAPHARDCVELACNAQAQQQDGKKREAPHPDP